MQGLVCADATGRHVSRTGSGEGMGLVARAWMRVVPVLLLPAVLALGCASSKSVMIQGEAISVPPDKLARGVEITAYRTRDGVRHSFQGRARLRNETVEFSSPRVWGDTQPRPFSLPIGEVASLETRRDSYLDSVALGTLVVVVVGVVALMWRSFGASAQ